MIKEEKKAVKQVPVTKIVIGKNVGQTGADWSFAKMPEKQKKWLFKNN